jgi:hypothetical protein
MIVITRWSAGVARWLQGSPRDPLPCTIVNEDGDREERGMMDALLFLRVSDALKEGFARLEAADLPASARDRWRRRLLAITSGAKRDLADAEEQYGRFRADFDREVGEPPAERGAVEDR